MNIVNTENIDINEFFYAQINEENICVGISSLSGEVIDEKFIEIESYDLSILGKKYNNGVWEEVPKEPIVPEEPQPTNAELKENQLAIMEAIATQYEENIENRLSDMEVQATMYEAILELGGNL